MGYSYSKDIKLNFADTEDKVKLALMDVGFGILMPCNILVIENEKQITKIVFPNAKNLLEITNNSLINELALKVDHLLKSAFDSIK